jgi:hypothetical protein
VRISTIGKVLAVSLCSLVSQPASTQTLGDVIDAFAREVQRTDRRKAQRVNEQQIRWLVISSRPEASEAVRIAQSFSMLLGPTMVAQSQNGSFAVVAGFLDTAKAKENAEALKSIRLIPQDAFLTAAERFRGVVWESGHGGGTVQIVHNPTLRQTVSRLQAALSQLGLYAGEVDGAVGPATSAAFMAYSAKFGPLSGTLDEFVLASMEQTAADGFKSESERVVARQKGFTDAATFAAARSGGFEDYPEYASANSAGFRSRVEYQAFRQSGFYSKDQFETATRAGFSTKTAFDTHQSKLMEVSKKQASELLADAEAFLRLNPPSSGIVELATKASALREASNGRDLPAIEAKSHDLTQSLSKLQGFQAFATARAAERQASEQAATAKIVSDLEARRTAIQQWMAQNLMHKASADLADELIAVEAALHAGDPRSLETSRDNLVALLERWAIKPEIDRYVQYGGQSPAAGAKSEYVVSRTPTNEFLLDGDGDAMVALYNASPTAPSIIKNLVGSFVFETGEATVCAYPPIAEPLVRRSIQSELAAYEVKTVRFNESGCAAEAVLKQDVLLLKRRDFLKGEPSFVLAVMERLKSGEIRRFDGVSDARLRSRQKAEQDLRVTIAREVDSAARNGFGAFLMEQATQKICVVVDGDTAVHEPILAQVTEFIASEGRVRPSVIAASAEGSYRALQRQECSGLYASQPDLKKLSAALVQDGRKLEFLPLWFEANALSVARKEHEQGVKRQQEELESRRLAAEEERRLAEEQDMRRKADSAVRERELQAKYGAEARALQTAVSEGLRLTVLGTAPTIKGNAGHAFAEASRGLYPKFHGWNSELASDFWKPTEVKTEIVDYGIANWKGRGLEAIAVEARVDLVSSERGEHRQACFVFGVLADEEFDVYRDGVEFECAGSAAGLTSWTMGHQLESRWRVSAE